MYGVQNFCKLTVTVTHLRVLVLVNYTHVLIAGHNVCQCIIEANDRTHVSICERVDWVRNTQLTWQGLKIWNGKRSRKWSLWVKLDGLYVDDLALVKLRDGMSALFEEDKISFATFESINKNKLKGASLIQVGFGMVKL